MTTTYTSEQIIDTLFVGATKYISLHTANPGATGASEVTSGVDANYERKSATLVKSLDGTVYRARNNSDIVFEPGAVGASYTALYLGIWDSATAGNCIAVAQITGSGLPVVEGTVITFATNDIVVRGE